MKTNFVLGGFVIAAVSMSTLGLTGCSGGGVGFIGGDGGSATTRTAESSCDVVITWLQSCKMTLDKAKCVKGASAYSQKQLEGAEQCTHRSDCDKAAFGVCMDAVEASEPAASPASGSSGTTSKDAGARTTNDPTSGGADAGTSTGGSNGGTGTCQSCITTECAPEIQTCQGSAPCSALASCISAANGDKTKQQACATQNSGGVAAYNAIITCGESACTAACSQ